MKITALTKAGVISLGIITLATTAAIAYTKLPKNARYYRFLATGQDFSSAVQTQVSFKIKRLRELTQKLKETEDGKQRDKIAQQIKTISLSLLYQYRHLSPTLKKQHAKEVLAALYKASYALEEYGYRFPERLKITPWSLPQSSNYSQEEKQLLKTLHDELKFLGEINEAAYRKYHEPKYKVIAIIANRNLARLQQALEKLKIHHPLLPGKFINPKMQEKFDQFNLTLQAIEQANQEIISHILESTQATGKSPFKQVNASMFRLYRHLKHANPLKEPRQIKDQEHLPTEKKIYKQKQEPSPLKEHKPPSFNPKRFKDQTQGNFKRQKRM